MAGDIRHRKMPAVVRTESATTTNSSFAPDQKFSWLDGDARGEHRRAILA